MENHDQKNALSRSLKSRHIQMIAIGGAIGTGLFLGSGSAIHTSGPSIILSYLIVGAFCFLLMRGIGELLLSDTSKHSFRLRQNLPRRPLGICDGLDLLVLLDQLGNGRLDGDWNLY